MNYRFGGACVQKAPAKRFFCEDRILASCDHGTYFLCVSDGLGSCAQGHIGAYYAVRFFSESACVRSIVKSHHPDQEFQKKIINYQKFLTQKAKKYRCDIKDLSSTLVLVLVGSFGVMGFRVGDGFAVVRFENSDVYQALFASSKDAMDVTSTLLSSDVSASYFSSFVRPEFCFVSSDGLYGLTFDVKEMLPYQAFFRSFEEGARVAKTINPYVQRVLSAASQKDPSDDKSVLVLLSR
ncbi:MAG: protein phosphatase 2C domain-containing protein [Alphaproteobacteria bacterium]|nr:protein phosphatase 2C domain-containing protein [Alphaproteobacteria bacterium]